MELPKNVKKIYFLHIPKTAGTYLKGNNKLKKLSHGFCIDNAYRLSKYENGHKTYKTNYYKIYKFPIINNIKITIIRNPFDLLCSYYFHGNHGWASVNKTHNFNSFNDFIKAYCDKKFKWHVPLLKQFLFSQIFDKKGNCVVDVIIKYEYLFNGLKKINKHFNENIFIIDKVIKRKSERKKKNYKEYYTNELIKLILKKCERELKLFKYNFNGSIDDNSLIFPKNIKYDIFNDKVSGESSYLDKV